MKKVLFISLCMVMFASCTYMLDPSSRDLKSPCVSSPFDIYGKSPCTKRTPSGNIPMLV